MTRFDLLITSEIQGESSFRTVFHVKIKTEDEVKAFLQAFLQHVTYRMSHLMCQMLMLILGTF